MTSRKGRGIRTPAGESVRSRSALTRIRWHTLRNSRKRRTLPDADPPLLARLRAGEKAPVDALGSRVRPGCGPVARRTLQAPQAGPHGASQPQSPHSRASARFALPWSSSWRRLTASSNEDPPNPELLCRRHPCPSRRGDHRRVMTAITGPGAGCPLSPVYPPATKEPSRGARISWQSARS